ncbi:S-adenosyl-L-methionine-dependent methyltransferase [Mycena rosella]|uniref:S-adenosyl-L-methionine-dependent methyltransferase n=1 Tax=Mycena rosella TaxID=1033263 RepID=A0AAD7DZ65_MYCRO|nr:S-adenosyl-L-methionine-dependent methyltransferase [Mycena rosella]
MSEPDEDDLDALTVLGEHLINSILFEEPLESIKRIIATGAPLWYQNESEGISCLHAAAYIQDLDLVKLLLQDGALWNATDYLRNTAGDIALSFNNEEIYTIIRDAGIRAELVLALLSRTPLNSATSMILQSPDDTSAAVSTDAFLSSKLRFTVDDKGQEICMLNVEDEEIGVMMGWEAGIMRETVANLCLDREPKKILNVGFGLGIIDTLFQSLSPALHVIIEAHPDVLKHMRKLGWYEKPGVKILEGKWQDFINAEQLGSLVPEGGFDLIYTDPFAEDFAMLRRFFSHLRPLLGPRARFSFFNGLGATNALTYDVMCRVAEVNLADAGLNDVKWIDVDLSQRARDHFGDTRKYFTVPIYRLPIINCP